MHEIVERERLRAGVPGCAVVVVRDGEVLLNAGFGLRDVDAGLPVTTRTLFPIGSATKTFTAYLLLDEDLDAPLGIGLHDALSLRDCLTHRSGLPRHDLLWQAGDGFITRDELVAALPHLEPSAPFRQHYQYNNLLYIAAAHLATDGAFEQVLRDRVLAPLGLDRTTFDVTAAQRDDDHAEPYVLPDGDVAKQIPFATLHLAAPAGGLISCTDDLVPWLDALTGAPVELGTPAIAMPPRGPAGPFESLGYGLGLMVERYRGRVVTHHGGNIDGFSAQVLTRDDGVGIAVLTNLQTTWLRDALPYLLLDHLDGVPSPDHGAFFRDRLATLLAQGEPNLATSTTTTPPRPLPSYRGVFRHPGYGDLTVDVRDDVLVWQYRGLREGRLTHLDDDAFAAQVWLYGADRRYPALFDGSWHLHLEPAVSPVRFDRVAE